MMAKVVAFSNQKGGVGKTTTTVNLGFGLAQLGKKVLMIDLDPQGNMSTYVGFEEAESSRAITIEELMLLSIDNDQLPSRDTFIRTINENLDYIPATIALSELELVLVVTMGREYVLSSILDEIKGDYDYILIDCPPSLGMLNINALAASDSVVIPMQAHYFSAKGLELLLQSISKTKKKINPQLEIEGILMTMCNENYNLTKEMLEMVQSAYGQHIKIYRTNIPTSIKTAESAYVGKSLFDYAKKNKVTVAYAQFTQEFQQ